MNRSPLLLVLCFPVSVHSARWVNLLRGSRYRVVVAPSVLQDYCAEFSFSRTVRGRADADALQPGEIGVIARDAIDSLAEETRSGRTRYQPLVSAVQVGAEALPGPVSLLRLVRSLAPDCVHTLELQHAGYTMLEVREQAGERFPPWLASSWGSDVYLYRKIDRHRARLARLAARLDGFHSDCSRDHDYLRELGFNGRYFPPLAASGGVDLADYPDPASLPPPSTRDLVLIKGYHGWSGRAMDILLAVHRIAPLLRRYRIRVTHTAPAVTKMVDILRRDDRLDIAVDPYFPKLQTAIERLCHARLVVGYGLSDGISTTLLEAMAVGTFCIQASTACGSEWARPGREMLEVPPHDVAALADAIALAASDDALVDGCVHRNRREIEQRWSCEQVADDLHRGYDELLGLRREN